MRPRPPKTLKIGPYRYEITFKKDLTNDKGDALYGWCQNGEHTISIRTDLPIERERTTLVHEVLHALWDMSALPNKPAEEQAISTLAPLLIAFLEDNPKFLRYL